MVSDVRRVSPFREAIPAGVQRKVVVESGTGHEHHEPHRKRAPAQRRSSLSSSIRRSEPWAAENIKKSGFKNVTLLQKSTLNVTRDDLGGRSADVSHCRESQHLAS